MVRRLGLILTVLRSDPDRRTPLLRLDRYRLQLAASTPGGVEAPTIEQRGDRPVQAGALVPVAAMRESAAVAARFQIGPIRGRGGRLDPATSPPSPEGIRYPLPREIGWWPGPAVHHGRT
jgi:hypothetical protein